MKATASSCTAFTLNNMVDGGEYTLAVQGGGTGSCTFTARTPAGAVLQVKGSGVLPSVVGEHYLYRFSVLGNTAYVKRSVGF